MYPLCFTLLSGVLIGSGAECWAQPLRRVKSTRVHQLRHYPKPQTNSSTRFITLTPPVAVQPVAPTPGPAQPRWWGAKDKTYGLTNKRERIFKRIKSEFQPVIPEQITPQLMATFQARPLQCGENFVSGTIFQTQYNGKTEVWGAIPAHAVAFFQTDEVIGRYFAADVFDVQHHRFVTVPAEIVQLSAPGFLDVALVKLYTQGRVKLFPMPLDTQLPEFGTILSTQGFANRQAVRIDERETVSTSPFSIYTTMPYPRDQRMGLCGSAGSVAGQERCIGMHNGSRGDAYGEKFDKGYITPAWVLELLVLAYHEERTTFPLVFGDHTVLNLGVQEYITTVDLFNENGKKVYTYDFPYKFSYSKTKEMLEIFNPRYIDFTVRRVGWSSPGSSFMDTGRSNAPLEVGDIYRYDFKTRQIKQVYNESELFLMIPAPTEP